MLALSRNFTIFNNYNIVCVRNCRQPMCNNKQGFSCNQLCNRFLHNCFILNVSVGGRLIENNNRRIFHHSAGNCNSLAFSARKLAAAFSNLCIVTSGQLTDKFITSCRFRHLFDLLICGFWISHSDIFSDGIVKEEIVLRNVSIGVQGVQTR